MSFFVSSEANNSCKWKERGSTASRHFDSFSSQLLTEVCNFPRVGSLSEPPLTGCSLETSNVTARPLLIHWAILAAFEDCKTCVLSWLRPKCTKVVSATFSLRLSSKTCSLLSVAPITALLIVMMAMTRAKAITVASADRDRLWGKGFAIAVVVLLALLFHFLLFFHLVNCLPVVSVSSPLDTLASSGTAEPEFDNGGLLYCLARKGMLNCPAYHLYWSPQAIIYHRRPRAFYLTAYLPYRHWPRVPSPSHCPFTHTLMNYYPKQYPCLQQWCRRQLCAHQCSL